MGGGDITLRSAHCPGNLLVLHPSEVISGAGLETEKTGVNGVRTERFGKTQCKGRGSAAVHICGDKTAVC